MALKDSEVLPFLSKIKNKVTLEEFSDLLFLIDNSKLENAKMSLTRDLVELAEGLTVSKELSAQVKVEPGCLVIYAGSNEDEKGLLLEDLVTDFKLYYEGTVFNINKSLVKRIVGASNDSRYLATNLPRTL